MVLLLSEILCPPWISGELLLLPQDSVYALPPLEGPPWRHVYRWYFLSSVMNEPTALLPLQLLHVFFLSPYSNGYLNFCLPLAILHSLCVRETGSHRLMISGPLGVVLWITVLLLYFRGTGLCVWKMYKRERNMDTGRSKLHFFFLLR